MRYLNKAEQLSVWEITRGNNYKCAGPTLTKQYNTGKISLEQYTDKKPVKFGRGKQKQSCT